jgi:hypothetical protein
MRVRDDDGEQGGRRITESVDMRQEIPRWLRVQRDAQIQNQAPPLCFELDAGSADFLSPAVNADPQSDFVMAASYNAPLTLPSSHRRSSTTVATILAHAFQTKASFAMI